MHHSKVFKKLFTKTIQAETPLRLFKQTPNPSELIFPFDNKDLYIYLARPISFWFEGDEWREPTFQVWKFVYSRSCFSCKVVIRTLSRVSSHTKYNIWCWWNLFFATHLHSNVVWTGGVLIEASAAGEWMNRQAPCLQSGTRVLV